MSATIDERVVEMRFDNQQFEQGVKTSLETLAKLRDSLNMDTATKSLDNLSKASNRFNLDGVGNAVETVQAKFSALEVVAFTALQRITNQAIDTGEKLIKSLSIDQVTAGYDKFETKTQAIQTIMAATGKSIEEVTKYVDKLNWYTDETSYNLVDMIGNIGRFTSNAVDLEDATNAMIGIANAAALAGANASKASHAMEGFSGAMAKGAMGRQHWKWIQTAGMDTALFKQTIIDTALELGTLQMTADGVAETIDGCEVSFDNFESELKKNWATSEVIVESLKKYSGELDTVYDQYLLTGETTSTILDQMGDKTDELWFKSFRAAQEAKTFTEAIDSVKDAVSTGWMITFEQLFGNYEEGKVLWTDVANALWEVFAAGGAARNEMLKAWNDLYGRIYLLGGLEQAFVNIVGTLGVVKEAFEEIFPPMTAERLYELTKRFTYFVQSLTPTEYTLTRIKAAFMGLFSIVKVGIRVIKAIGAGFKPVLDVLIRLADLLLSASAYAGTFLVTLEEYADALGIFETVTNAIKTGLMVFVGVIAIVVTSIAKLISEVRNVVYLREMAKTIGEAATAASQAHPVVSALATAFEVLRGIVAIAAIGLVAFVGVIATLVSKITLVPAYLKSVYDQLTFLHPAVNFITNAFTALIDAIRNYPETLKLISGKFAEVSAIVIGFFKTVKDNLKNVTSVGDLFDKLRKAIGDFIKDSPKLNARIEKMKEKLAELKTMIVTFASDIKSKLSGVDLGTVLGIVFGISLLNAVMVFTKLSNNIANLAGSLNSTFVTFNKVGNAIFNSLKPSMLIQVATSLTMLAGALYLVSTIPTADLIAASIAIGILGVELAALAGIMTALQKFSKLSDTGFAKISLVMVGLAAGVLLLAAAVKTLEGVKLDADLGTRLFTIGIIMAELVAATVLISHLAGPMSLSVLALIAFAASINLIVNALVKLGETKLGNAQTNLDMLGSMMISLSVLALSASRLKFFSAAALLTMIGSLFLIEKALKQIIENGVSVSDIKTNLDKFIPVIASLGILAVMCMAIGTNKGSIGGALTIAAFALALFSMLHAIDQLKDYSLPELARGVGAVVALMLGTRALLAVVERVSKEALKIAPTIIAIGVCMLLLTQVVKQLSDLSTEGKLEPGMNAIVWLGLLCAGLIAVTHLAAGVKAGPILAMVVAMGVVTAAISILYIFKDSNRLLFAALAFVIGLGGMAASLALLANSAAKISVTAIFGFIAIIGALAVAAGAIAMIAKIDDPVNVAVAAASMAGIIFVLSKALPHAEGALKSAAAMALMSVPLILAASSLRILASGEYEWEKIVAAAGSLSVTMVALAFAANLADTAVAGAAAMVLIGIGALALAGAMSVLGEVNYENLVPNLEATGVALVALIAIAGAAGLAFPYLALGIIALAAALAVIVLAANGFALAVNVIAISIKMMADAFDQAGSHAPENAKNISAAIITILSSIGKGAGEMVTTFAKAMTEGIAKAFDSALKAISAKIAPFKGVIQLVCGAVTSTFGGLIPDLKQVATTAFGGFTQTAGDELKGMEDIGHFTVDGFLGGIISKLKPVKDTAITLADEVTNSMCDELDIHSPSLLTQIIGAFTSQGFGMGILSKIDEVAAAAGTVANAAVDNLQNTFSKRIEAFAANYPLAGKLFGALQGELSHTNIFKAKIGTQQQAKIDAAAWGDDSDEANVAADSVDNLASAFDGLTHSMSGVGGGGGGGGGGAAGAAGEVKDALTELTETIQNQMDVFSRYDAQFNIMGQSLINNMKSQIAGTKNWADSIKLLAKSGIDEGLLASLRDMGPQGASYVQAFLTMSREQLNEASSLFRESLTEPAILASEILDGVATTTEASTEIIKTATEAGAEFVAASAESAEAAEYQVQRIQQAYENMRVSLAGTISNQISIFDKFDDSTEQTAEEVLQNMNSQLNGMDNWANMLIELAERGIDQGLLQHLADMGPAGYELTHAFVTMTNEQLQKAGELYQSSLTIDTTLSNRIVDSWKAVGVGLTDGLIDGVQQPDAEGAIVAVADGMEEAFREETQTHSPSEVYRGLGESLIQGLIEGINSGVTAAKDAMSNVANLAFDTYNEHTPLEKYVELGARLCEGIAKGITDGSAVVKGAVVQVANDVYGSFASAWDIHSPSRRFAELGMYADEGLAMGLSGYAKVVSDSASNVGNETINSLSESLNRVGEVVSNDIDVDPTIRPVLDLSSVRAGAGQIDSMLSDQYMTVKGISGTIGGETSRLAALLSGMQASDNQNGVIDAIQGLRKDFATMSDRIQRMQIVLDTGVVAGAVTPAVGDRLQHEAQMKGMVWA